MAETLNMFDFDVPPPRPTVPLTQDRTIQDGPTISKIAGTPYMPASVEWPIFRHGPMRFFAQLNFGELPALPGFPRHGILQLFGGTDEVYGLDDPDGSFVRYIEDTSEPSVGDMPEEAIGTDGPFSDPWSANPLRGEELQEVRPGYDDVTTRTFSWSGEFDNGRHAYVFLQRDAHIRHIISPDDFSVLVRDRLPDGSWRASSMSCLGRSAPQRVRELTEDAKREGFVQWEPPLDRVVPFSDGKPWGHRLGGYPGFTQSDPRPPEDPRILLVQIDSDEGLMWGDNGIANWFITPDELVRRDFSNVLFNWDCG